MGIEAIKKLIKKHIAGHAEFVLKAHEAERYYRNRTDILKGSQPKPEEKENSKNPIRNADNRIPFNFHGLLVNQKASYMFTAPPLFDLGNKQANKQLYAFLGDKYAKVCKDLCINASNTSVGWIHMWKEADTGKFKYAVVPSAQIIPIWSTSLDKELVGVLRHYHDTTENGEEQDIYEYWSDTTCQSYSIKAGGTIDNDLCCHNAFVIVDNENSIPTNEYEHGMGEVPFFPFFNNNINTNDLDNIKPLIDVYCKVFSGFVNDLEDIQEVIFILTNYGGANLGEFLSDLKKYKAIKIDNDGGDDKSGVSTLSIELPVEARKELLSVTRKCIFEQGQGIDPDPQNFGNSSGVALGFLYSLLELKAGLQETEFRLGFGRFIRCACRAMGIPIKDDALGQTWTRTSVRNDQELASIAQQSNGVISKKTIVKNHPWCEDVEKELQQIETEEKDAEEKADLYNVTFGQQKGTGEDNNQKDVKSKE